VQKPLDTRCFASSIHIVQIASYNVTMYLYKTLAVGGFLILLCETDCKGSRGLFNFKIISDKHLVDCVSVNGRGTRWRSLWFTGSFPDGVIRIFHSFINRSISTMIVGSTRPPAENWYQGYLVGD